MPQVPPLLELLQGVIAECTAEQLDGWLADLARIIMFARSIDAHPVDLTSEAKIA